MTGMQAAVRDRYGSPDVVEVREVDRPTPVDDEVLVRVRAASVNRADLDGITPRPSFVRLFIGLRAPRDHRLGLDVAGVVESVGPDVTRFRPGDGVFADLFAFGQGAFAEYVCAPERAFAPIPAGHVVRGGGRPSRTRRSSRSRACGSATAGRSGPATRS